MSETTTTETGTASPETASPGAGAGASLAWGTTSFDPGRDVALVARDTVGLIERDNPSTRARLWGLVAADAPLDDILDELSSTGLKALPDFGLAQVEGSAVRIVARGRTRISAVLGSGSTHEIDPSGVRTWIEELVDDVAAITITLQPLDDDAPAESGEAFALLAGSVPASSLMRQYDAPDDHAEVAESGPGWTAGGTAVGDPDPVTEATDEEPAAVADVELEMVADVDAPGPASDDPWSGDGPGDGADDGADDEAGHPAAVIPPHPTTEPVGAEPASPQPPPPGAQLSGPPPSGPGAGGVPPATSTPDATVLAGSADGPTSSIFDPDFDSDSDFDDHAAGSVPGDAASPLIDAPAHGVLVFSNGERIEVDRAILIGRNPKVSAAAEGALPHIMKFDGPGQGLSRTHAEVRIEAGEVLVEDLESTNGTEVQLPGQQRRRLRGGEPVVIVPGALIDFGDELHCTLESTS